MARRTLRAACAPSCIATCATPGSGSPSCCSAQMSPTTKISGWPGTASVGSARTRPARSSGTPSACASGDAATPAAQSTVCAGRRSLRDPASAHVTPSASTPVTTVLVRTSTPRRSSDSARRFAKRLGKRAEQVRRALEQHDARRLGPDVPEVLAQRLPRDLGERAGQLDAGRPAADDDEGEQPALRVRGSVSRSAASNASSTRRLISSASSSVLRPGARSAHSGWPKYACAAPVATIR